MTRNYSILDKVNSPEDLKRISRRELPALADEIRHFIINSTAKNPGHLGANLGVVELSIALHYIFNSPEDPIIWDVGHQAYVHKILTGRKDLFDTNRKLNGISGFPRISESEHDVFGTGHSSTSISAALGMAMADCLLGHPKRTHIAVIGDGSITAGMAYEAINHAGASMANLLIILNDNEIAIDKNVGALRNNFAKITASHTYNRFKGRLYRLLRGTWFHKFVNKTTTAIKWTLLRQSNFFEVFNFRYFGPVDGHNLEGLIEILHDLKDIEGPRILHVKTQKGKGFKPAETDQVTFHSPGLFEPDTGELIDHQCQKKPPKYQVVYGKTLLSLAENDERIIGITPAMLSGSSLNIMQARFPHRVFDVGIAEQHAVTLAAGMAKNGLKPFCTIYSSFLQRAYDQLIHDVAIQNLPVVFGIDRGGLVGEDGATHQGVFDLAYLRLIPNLTIAAPMDEVQLRNLMYTATTHSGPFSIRYPRGGASSIEWEQPMEKLEIGKGRYIVKGDSVAILSIGQPGKDALDAVVSAQEKGFLPTLVDVVFLKPLDENLLHEVLKNHQSIITVEDGTVVGGLGSAIAEFALKYQYPIRLSCLGVPDRFIEHGSVGELKDLLGFDKKAIFEKIIDEFQQIKNK